MEEGRVTVKKELVLAQRIVVTQFEEFLPVPAESQGAYPGLRIFNGTNPGDMKHFPANVDIDTLLLLSSVLRAGCVWTVQILQRSPRLDSFFLRKSKRFVHATFGQAVDS